ncbi:hypothetical protein PGTUg99_036854 [Puccinia graminis f. sp. tritici]|uniref:Uncharacterized protein n=1 Tax=Puccinia graminis f. sp. tritici TaxID=56615 RepID=A0A5B0LWC0_PUCGR|nr:hypothetical protein PGTUg99_036854 [Puccinia graminis f. sp. tritici]
MTGVDVRANISRPDVVEETNDLSATGTGNSTFTSHLHRHSLLAPTHDDHSKSTFRFLIFIPLNPTLQPKVRAQPPPAHDFVRFQQRILFSNRVYIYDHLLPYPALDPVPGLAGYTRGNYPAGRSPVGLVRLLWTDGYGGYGTRARPTIPAGIAGIRP